MGPDYVRIQSLLGHQSLNNHAGKSLGHHHHHHVPFIPPLPLLSARPQVWLWIFLCFTVGSNIAKNLLQCWLRSHRLWVLASHKLTAVSCTNPYTGLMDAAPGSPCPRGCDRRVSPGMLSITQEQTPAQAFLQLFAKPPVPTQMWGGGCGIHVSPNRGEMGCRHGIWCHGCLPGVCS